MCIRDRVSDVIGDDIVFLDGADLSNQVIWHDSDGVLGIDFPEQITITSTGNVLAGGFTEPSGIYEYDTNGVQVDYIDTGAIAGLTGIRAAAELGNGNILFTNSIGVYIYERGSATITTVVSGVNARFIGGASAPSTIGQPFCMGNPNSSGNVASMTAQGSEAVADNSVTLRIADMPAGEFGIVVVAPSSGTGVMPPTSQGILCLTGPIGRYSQSGEIFQSDAGGSTNYAIDVTAIRRPTSPINVAAVAGDTWHFQAWFRDGGPANPTSNFTTGVSITFN